MATPDPFLLLILSSPSGAGKTTLTKKLQERFPELRFSVSHTTRKPRANESDHKDYHFVDRHEFDAPAAVAGHQSDDRAYRGGEQDRPQRREQDRAATVQHPAERVAPQGIRPHPVRR